MSSFSSRSTRTAKASAVALARLPGEPLPADAEGDPAGARGLDLGKGERELPHRLPVGHG